MKYARDIWRSTGRQRDDGEGGGGTDIARDIYAAFFCARIALFILLSFVFE